MKKRSVLLTGATGYLGSHLAEALADKPDIELRCLVRPRVDRKDDFLKKLNNNNVIYGDLLRPDSYDKALKGTEVVIHAATFATLYNHAEEEKRYYYEPTKELIERCDAKGVQRFIFAGAAGVLGFGLQDAKESLPRRPLSFWPHQNILIKIEELLERHQGEGKMETVIIRPGIFIGEGGGDHSMVIGLAEGLKKKQLPYIQGGKAVISVVSLKDVAEAFYLSVKSRNAAGQIYHISSDKKVTMKDIIDFIADELNYERPARNIPFSIAKTMGFLMEIGHRFTKKEPALCRTMAFMSGKGLHLSIDKAVKELGFAPKCTWQDALKKTLRWYKEEYR
ncbi:MAG: NAD-dependent epimerase/dehydratase family protein [Nitrospirota bacterium]|nr:NAD-dependent epimerase/dehydratase family protein [Nitrospirota bacterium]